MRFNILQLTFTAIALTTTCCSARLQETPAPEKPLIAGASDEAKNAMQVFLLPDRVTSQVFAAEPDVANPVAIDVDYQNRVFVCESYRQERGIEDNRNHPEWLQEDLAARTVADRLAYIHKHLGAAAIDYTKQDDLIRLLVDSDDDGIADQSTVFANRFNAIEEGTGAGILSYRGEVYYTCIPRLWKLLDRDGDGISDTRESMHEGFGVRFAFRGHDLHGLIIGPDGRLYFSIGDRGYHVNDEISDPESGAVFRCELDGSSLQVIATGLRNPQELAFDNYGNLFTGDNNSDSGDRARMVYVVQGSDSGWRMHYQYLPDRGPFNRERIWHPYDPETTPAYIVPPIDNFADGPSGLAYYPGSGFSDHMIDRFLLCDFRGQTSGSGIKTFRLKPDGAFYEIADEENTFWNILATDCCFGPDGRLYVSDWVHGWDGVGKGRVYALTDNAANIELRRQVKALLASDWERKSSAMLVSLLGHADRRVRQEAQFELANRNAFIELEVIARSGSVNRLARIHAIWALDQISRSKNASERALARINMLLHDLLEDSDKEIQSQSAKLIGELLTQPGHFDDSRGEAIERLSELLKTGDDRTRFFASISLGKIGRAESTVPLLDLLAENNNADPILRHGGIMALVYQTHNHNDELLNRAVHHDSPAVRLAAVVALRKLRRQGYGNDEWLRKLLTDIDSNVALEVVRAVHDLPILELQPDLGNLSKREHLPDPVARRVLNANFRMGDGESLTRVRNFVLDDTQILDQRIDAVQMLIEWNNPPDLDKVLGMWRPLGTVNRATNAPETVADLFTSFESLDLAVGSRLVRAAEALKVKTAIPVLTKIFRNDNDVDRRRNALQGLVSLVPGDLTQLIEQAMASEEPELRIVALNYLANRDVSLVKPAIDRALRSESTPERQNAIAILGKSSDPMTRDVLDALMGNLDTVNKDSQLDVVLAAQARQDDVLKKRAREFLAISEKSDPHQQYRLALHGGNWQRGSDIFYNRTDVSCLRCHKIQESGGDVGPDLSDVGAKRDREYLLESLIEPSKTITENFETVVVLDTDGKTHIGVTKASTKDVLSIMTAEAILLNIPTADIEEMRRGDSAMPDDVTKHLTLSELRDLIEFLATRTQQIGDSN